MFCLIEVRKLSSVHQLLQVIAQEDLYAVLQTRTSLSPVCAIVSVGIAQRSEHTFCQKRDLFNGFRCCTGSNGDPSELNACSEVSLARQRLGFEKNVCFYRALLAVGEYCNGNRLCPQSCHFYVSCFQCLVFGVIVSLFGKAINLPKARQHQEPG